MMHHKREFVAKEESRESLARKLVNGPCTGRTAFICGEWLFANDSISPDGHQEYGVFEFKDGKCGRQMESLTITMYTEKEFLAWFEAFNAPDYEHEVVTDRPIKFVLAEK